MYTNLEYLILNFEFAFLAGGKNIFLVTIYYVVTVVKEKGGNDNLVWLRLAK